MKTFCQPRKQAMLILIIVGDKENNDGAYIETGKPGEDKDRSKSRTKSRSEEKKERMVWSQQN